MIWLTPGLFFVCVTLLVYLVAPLLRVRADIFLQEALKQAETAVDSLYMEFHARQVLYAAAISSVACLLFGLLLSGGVLLFGLLFGVAGYFLPKLFFKVQLKRRREKLNAQLVGAIELLSNALKAGANFTRGLKLIPQEMSAPIAQEFALVLKEMELGVKQEEALNNLARRVESKEYLLVATATNIARESGGNLAEIFDRIAKTIRDRNKMLGKVKAQTAEGRMQGIFVGLLPLILGAGLMVVDPEMVKPMFTTTTGHIMLIAIVVMELLGAYFINKVITIDV
jgi:tight adherence protein B